MTHDEWDEYADDLNLLIRRARAIVYEHEDAEGALQLLLQPRSRVDITRLRWVRRKRNGPSPLH